MANEFDRLSGVLGICYSDETMDSRFPYGIGAGWNGTPLGDVKLDIVDV